jgi:hypothetical protein
MRNILVHHTGYGLGVPCTLSSGNEDHISLTDICVAVFEEKNFVDAIILESRELDEYADWASQTPLKDQILLPPYLQTS